MIFSFCSSLIANTFCKINFLSRCYLDYYHKSLDSRKIVLKVANIGIKTLLDKGAHESVPS